VVDKTKLKFLPPKKGGFFCGENMGERMVNQLELSQKRFHLYQEYLNKAEELKIPLYPEEEEINRLVDIIEKKAEKPPNGSIELRFKNKGYPEQLVKAGAFYTTMIKPMVATGRDAYKPTEEDIKTFCTTVQGAGVNLVLYYAFSKTRSPGRTNSPDWKVDFAELEMLRYWGLVAKVGERIGVKMKFIMVDETTIFPIQPNFLGNHEEDLEFNQRLFEEYTKGFGTAIIYRSLWDSVAGPLGNDFKGLYQSAYQQAGEELKQVFNRGELSPEIVRTGIFLDILPQPVLENFGLSSADVEEINANIRGGNLNCLLNLPENLLSELINLTTHVKSIMTLRATAAEVVHQNPNLSDNYPEYNQNRLYGGVTRSNGRWSFLPLPVRYNGMTVNPMHGLAVYSREERKFLGICPWRNLPEGSEVVYLDNGKPLLVLK
jgi:hypothetical protein